MSAQDRFGALVRDHFTPALVSLAEAIGTPEQLRVAKREVASRQAGDR